MRFLCLIAVLLFALPARAATVYGNIQDATGTGQDGPVLFHPLAPQVYGTNYITAIDRSVHSTNGSFITTLLPNSYKVYINGSSREWASMDVPNDNGRYNWIDLITSRITYVYLTPLRILTNYVLTADSTLSIVTNTSGTNVTLQLSVVAVPAHQHAGSDITSGLVSYNFLQAPGADGQVMVNSAGGFAGDTNLTWDAESKTLNVPKLSTTSLTVTGTLTPPTNADDPGLPGQLTSDGNYFYFCVATNTWKRWSMSTW